MYYIVLAAVTLIWTLSMCILFVDVIIIRRKYHDSFTRIQLAPDWVFYLCAVLGLVASGVGFYATVTAPWVPLINVTGWDEWVVGIALLSLVIGVVVYFIGEATARSARTQVADVIELAKADEVAKAADVAEVAEPVNAVETVEIVEAAEEPEATNEAETTETAEETEVAEAAEEPETESEAEVAETVEVAEPAEAVKTNGAKPAAKKADDAEAAADSADKEVSDKVAE